MRPATKTWLSMVYPTLVIILGGVLYDREIIALAVLIMLWSLFFQALLPEAEKIEKGV